jgi:hypothetical protein
MPEGGSMSEKRGVFLLILILTAVVLIATVITNVLYHFLIDVILMNYPGASSGVSDFKTA